VAIDKGQDCNRWFGRGGEGGKGKYVEEEGKEVRVNRTVEKKGGGKGDSRS
jgi:hypothetical protein